uniref:Acyl-UDP-N-acetylglucosamine o-acyltransferase n=1 Tax=Cyanidium sp. THAL103 TaxID=3027999 RepID=A0A9Y1MY21_9RHOD|nr:acyl-UDP-N-acetylglucosamine o-acyltransferase [Cyanidium sp. THAL103]
MLNIHSTAIIHPTSIISKNVTIGPYSIIGPNVFIGSFTKIGSYVIINENSFIGQNNQIFSGCSIGSFSQDLKYDSRDKLLGITYIGNNNLIREYTTINRPSTYSNITYIGNNNLIMSYVHIAHDCKLKNNIILANAVSIAGHVTVESFVVIGGMSGIHQFVKLGKLSMIAAMTKIIKDVPPFVIVDGNPPHIRGINIVGLKRNHIQESEITEIKKIYRLLKNNFDDFSSILSSISITETLNSKAILVNHFLSFMKTSLNQNFHSRGLTSFIIKKNI